MVRTDRHSMRLLFVILGVHGLLASFINLSVDEAHYALYASHLDWSYFDHPPLVGWIQWPAQHFSSHDFTMRLASLLCWGLTALTIMTLTQRLFPASTPTASPLWRLSFSNRNIAIPHSGLRIDLLLFLASPLLNLLGIALVPDSLLMLLSCLIMASVWSLVTTTKTSIKQWSILGLLLGLAGLSKYTSAILALEVFLILLIAKGWRLAINPGAWITLLLAILLTTPVLYWNATHEWISFSYQLHHAAGGATWELKRIFCFILVQCICFGFLLPIGLLAVKPTKPRRVSLQKQSPAPLKTLTPLSYNIIIGIPFLLAILFASGQEGALPHWTAPAWVMLIPAAATGCGRLWHSHRRWLLGLGGFQILSCLVIAVILIIGGIGSESGAQAFSRPGELIHRAPINPIADLYGWKDAALYARELAQKNHIKTLAVMNWSMASRIAWYAQPFPVKVIFSHHDQFDLWFGPPKHGESMLLVDWSIMGYDLPIARNQFKQCDWLDQQPVQHAGRQIAHFNFMLCRAWQGGSDLVEKS